MERSPSLPTGPMPRQTHQLVTQYRAWIEEQRGNMPASPRSKETASC